MRKLQKVKLVYWGAGWCCIGVAWVNEFVEFPDFVPRIFGENVNISEALIESIGILMVMLVGAIMLRGVEREMRYLEGFALLCCNCKRVRVEDRWEEIETWMSSRSDVMLSHGMCEDCLHRLYPKEAESIVRNLKE